MKLLFLFIIFFTFVTEAYSANTKLKKNEKYSNKITWKNIQFKLPNGEWIYYSKEPFHLQNFSLGCINKSISSSGFGIFIFYIKFSFF